MRKSFNQKKEGVSHLEELLREIINDPGPHRDNKDLLFALSSQSSLANYCDTERRIHGSSLNTLKRRSDATTVGGFAALDLLRKSALTALTKKLVQDAHPGRGSKAYLAEKVEDLERTIQTLNEDLLLLTLVLEKSLQQSRTYAEYATDSIRALCKKEQRELFDIISVRKIPDSAKVIRLHDV